MKFVSLQLNRPLWVGMLLGIGLRVFAYGALVGISSIQHFPLTADWLQHALVGIYWLVAFFSPFWVPFAGGFFSSYYWRTFPAPEYTGAINITSSTMLFALSALLVYNQSWMGIGFLVVLAYVDAGMCRSGFERGRKFWNGRLGHQFLGDFSANDEEIAPSDYF